MSDISGPRGSVQWQTNPLYQDVGAKKDDPSAKGVGTGTPPTSPHDAKGSHGLLSGSELVARMGSAPKTDVTIFGKTLKTNSAAYKETLGHLEAYQDKLTKLAGTNLSQVDKATVDELKHELTSVIQQADAYEAKHASSSSKADRRGVMGELKQMARDELGRLDDLSKLKGTGGKSIDLPDALALLRGGVTDVSLYNKDMNDQSIDKSKSKDNFGAGKANSVSLLAYGSDVRVVKSLSKEAEKLMAGESTTGFDQKDMRTGARNIASANVAQELGIGHSIPKPDIVIHNGQAALAMHRAPGESVIYKHEAPVTDAQEIKRFDGELSRGWLDNLKNYGVRKDENGVWQKTVTDFKDIPYSGTSNPPLTGSIQKGLLDLQTMDCLMAQMDRQPENIFIQITGNTAKITGIDNDMCMGPGMKKLDSLDDGKPLRQDLKSTYGGPPPLMSRTMYDKLKGMSEDTFKAQIGPEFSPEEISAACDRLTLLKDHGDKLLSQGRVVDNFETWTGTDPKTGTTVGASQFLQSAEERSYVRREVNTLSKAGTPLVPLDVTKH
jgi:hypothetical protein